MKATIKTVVLMVLIALALMVPTQPAIAQQESLSGWFHVIWGDPPPDSNVEPVIKYVLIDDQGQWTEMLLDEDLVRPFGGPLAFNRKRVTVVGEWENALPGEGRGTISNQPSFQVDSIQFEQPKDAFEQAEDAEADELEGTPRLALKGPQPWVTILCRFSDSASVTPHDVSWFNTLMGNSYPGMGHYWREVSYNNIDLTGSVVVGWYNLPQPRSYYLWDGKTANNQERLVNDCTAAADADVFFPNFYGINLMFNEDLDFLGHASGATLTRDGQTKSYAVTFMPRSGYENQWVLGQEMGHGFGLPHSSGPYSATYDSQWDTMSGGGTCSSRHPQYGCIGVHTISYHKDFLGWIPSSRKFVPIPGSSQTIVLERLGQPMFSTNHLMAQIPIAGSTTQFYTVEARRSAGYDNQIPGEAVVIHRVDTTMSDRLAQVVDADGNGNPNDAGAMWPPGETFTDVANGITVSVDAAATTGFTVTIASAGWGAWEDLGGDLVGGPAVSTWGPDRLDVFARGRDGALWFKPYLGPSEGWAPWERLGGILTSDPAVVSWGYPRIDIFGRGQNGHLWHLAHDSSGWGSWEDLGGDIVGGPAVSIWGPNRLEIFARGQDNQLYHKAWTGSFWSDWRALGGYLTSDPAAVSWGPGRIDVFARGLNGHLWHRAFSSAVAP